MPARSLALTRTLIGLLQGGFLYLLDNAVQTKSWPATTPYVFAVMTTIGCAVPLLAVVGLSNLRLRTLLSWLVVATVLCSGIAAYGIYRDPLPTNELFLSTAPALFVIFFIMQSLIAAGEADGRIIAGYPRYFDISWKLGVQFVLALLFVAALWGLLWLGAALFNLIKINLLSELIQKRWFSIPVTTMAMVYSLHVTDLRANLVTGARSLIFTLLSWLLPVMTLFAVLFLLALPVVGLEPLWATRRAANILLTSVAALVFLINAVYQDGESETPPLLRQSRWLAAIAIVPLVTLAGHGLMLRVEQYGWTQERVVAAACVVVAACYAAGYALAAIVSRRAMKPLEPTNVFTACVIVAVSLALLSPIADPARISVADQISRLDAGRIAPDKFDFAFLRFRSGRYGTEALQRLADAAEGPQAALIMERAKFALQSQSQYQMRQVAHALAANITVIHPAGATLPESFLQADWITGQHYLWQVPGCLLRDAKCEAVLIDLDGDGHDEILLFSLPPADAAAFRPDGEGRWNMLGPLVNGTCPAIREALRAGKFDAVTPSMKDVEVAGLRLIVNRNSGCKPGPKP